MRQSRVISDFSESVTKSDLTVVTGTRFPTIYLSESSRTSNNVSDVITTPDHNQQAELPGQTRNTFSQM